MTTKDYPSERTTGKTLDDLYRVARSLEAKVDEILEEMHELTEVQGDRSYRAYSWHDQDEENHYG